MKRAIVAVVAILAASGMMLAAEGFGEPNAFYEPASIGMLLPEDTEVEEADGIVNFWSEGAQLLVSIGELEKSYKNADILNSKTLIAVLKEAGAEKITPWTSTPEGDLVWNSATVSMKFDDGSSGEGYMILLNSKAAKGSSFLIGIFVEKLDTEDYESASFIALETLCLAKP